MEKLFEDSPDEFENIVINTNPLSPDIIQSIPPIPPGLKNDENNKSLYKTKTYNLSSSTCSNCGKVGHLFYQCKLPFTSYGIILFRLNHAGCS